MSAIDWAEREVEIACKRENPDRKDGEFDYGCACYESALRAYKCLMNDGHSGFSIGVTKSILNRLIDGKPLTPIEDTDDIWDEVEAPVGEPNIKKFYQCKRMSSLFKEVHLDGSIKYSDINSYHYIDINGFDYGCSNRLVNKIIEDLFPITMPYKPGNPIKVYTEDFLTDKEYGDYDTVGVLFATKPTGEMVVINRFFKEYEHGKLCEIDQSEYEERKAAKIKRGW